MIIWSDDCLSCLCNFPHTVEKHNQELEKAESSRQEQMADMRSVGHVGTENKAAPTPLTQTELARLMKYLETSLHGF